MNFKVFWTAAYPENQEMYEVQNTFLFEILSVL